MGCVVYKPRPMTFGEATDGAGFSRIPGIEREYDELVDLGDGPVFMCGPGAEKMFARCVVPGCPYLSELLCDYPMGRGKTCDLALCEDHAREIGEDRHLCPIHFAEWVEKTRGARLNPWPPPRSGR